ncbi:hypothetical protein GCM10007857_30590 [Bradyrhizobium iriomotense]|uniref:Uncharacterized protein n=1 Tax=Bradyrhizobium iriomotense TaxID=441950 RepID=A0ABQ6B2F0_9BRAD|nr:hypothetical protein GCM10007857_30590 [Bradyrhizobium iriomotense]
MGGHGWTGTGTGICGSGHGNGHGCGGGPTCTGGSGPMMIGEEVFAALSACATPTNALTARNERQNARKVIVVDSYLGALPIRSRQD